MCESVAGGKDAWSTNILHKSLERRSVRDAHSALSPTQRFPSPFFQFGWNKCEDPMLFEMFKHLKGVGMVSRRAREILRDRCACYACFILCNDPYDEKDLIY